MLNTGFRAFLKVWNEVGGIQRLTLRPLLPELTTIYRYKDGTFAGLTNSAFPMDGNKPIPPSECLIIVNEQEADNFYGHSRHDDDYDAYCNWHRSQARLVQTVAKIAGSIVIVYHPPGQSKINGELLDNSVVAGKIGAALKAGNNFVTCPSLALDVQQIQQKPELSKVSLWKVEVIATGEYAPAVANILEQQGYYDKLKCRAWGTPERALLEAQTAGSRADASTADAQCVDDMESIEDSIVSQLNHGGMGNQGAVDDFLRFNFGEDAVGTVVIKPAPLVDEKRQFKQDLLKAWFPVDPELQARTNREAMLKEQEIPANEDFNLDEFKAEQAAMQPVQPEPIKPGEKKPANGNKRQLQTN